jgi:hypothetical protein
MINRFSFSCFGSPSIDPVLRPRINTPHMDRKTRADIRREILEKLTVRLRNLGVSSG